MSQIRLTAEEQHRRAKTNSKPTGELDQCIGQTPVDFLPEFELRLAHFWTFRHCSSKRKFRIEWEIGTRNDLETGDDRVVTPSQKNKRIRKAVCWLNFYFI
jgi:hypothetical protein